MIGLNTRQERAQTIARKLRKQGFKPYKPRVWARISGHRVQLAEIRASSSGRLTIMLFTVRDASIEKYLDQKEQKGERDGI